MALELSLSRKKQFPTTRLRFGLIQAGIIVATLYLISFYSYLLFHTLDELITAAIAGAIFMLTWNSRKYQANNYYLFFGIAFLFIGFLIVLHALTYRGMTILASTANDANIGTQLWLAIQYFLAATFFITPFILDRKINFRIIFIGYLTAFTFILLSIFFWHNFPIAYIEGKGLTSFKEKSEYIVAFIFLVSIYLFYRQRDKFEWKVLRLLIFVLVLLAASTIVFTLYFSVYSFFNILGHLLRILAFYGIYLAFIEYGLMRPYGSIFKELNESRQEMSRLASFPMLNPQPIVEIDLDGNIYFANPAAKKLIPDLKKLGINHPWLASCNKAAILNHSNETKTYDHEVAVEKRWYYQAVHFVSETGRVRIYGHEITKRKKAEREIIQAKEEWEKTFDSVPYLIAIIDKNYKIRRANKAMTDKLNLAGEKYVGLNCYQCTHNTSEPPENCPHSQTLTDGKEHTWEIEEPNLGGTFTITTTPLFDKEGKITGSVHMARDITERKKMEKAKDEFVALSSHQLRTPLSNIRLSSELMLRGLTEDSPVEQRSFLEEIQKATKRMTILVNNLLNISRLEMGNFDINLEPFDIAGAFKAITNEFIPLINEKNLRLNLFSEENLPIIYFDENIFRIIMENLLSNSIRYTPENGWINLELRKENFSIVLKISDSGYGIPEDQQDEIFKKSFRAENAKAITSEGAGLGLYMVKSICQHIGADIWFQSGANKGATFFVSIPIEEEKQMRML